MITSDRDVFIGAHVTPEVAERLDEEANRRHISKSLLIYRILREAFGLKEKKREP